MTDLEAAIINALASPQDSKISNKAYLEFIKANFIIPIEAASDPDNPVVLYLQEKDKCFLPVFTSRDYLEPWAADIKDNIKLLVLSGVDLLKGLGEDVILCLDIGTPHYKEFNPQELDRMRSMVIKFFTKVS